MTWSSSLHTSNRAALEGADDATGVVVPTGTDCRPLPLRLPPKIRLKPARAGTSFTTSCAGGLADLSRTRGG